MTKRLQPTADHFAWAIVAASREVNEDPIAVATGRHSKSQAQLYAFAALRECFADAPAHHVAELLGVENPAKFVRAHAARCDVSWWSASALSRVTRSIEALPSSVTGRDLVKADVSGPANGGGEF